MFINATMVPSRFAEKERVSGVVVARTIGSVVLWCLSCFVSAHIFRCVCVVVKVLTAVGLWTVLPFSGVRQWLYISSLEQTHGQHEVGDSSTSHSSRIIM